MQISVENDGDGIRRIRLRGRMDIAGTESIELPLVVETASEKGFVVIDLTGVEFLASVGIGLLLRSIKALRNRGGEAVLLSSVPVVTLVLETTGIPKVVAVVGDIESARQLLLPVMRR